MTRSEPGHGAARRVRAAAALLAAAVAASVLADDGVLGGKGPSWSLYGPPGGARASTNQTPARAAGASPAATLPAAPATPAPLSVPGPAVRRKRPTGWMAVWDEGLPRGMSAARPDAVLTPAAARAQTLYGIAAGYPDDRGLERDSDVVVGYDFEEGRIRHAPADAWCGVPWGSASELVRGEAVSGDACLANRWKGKATGGTASRWFLEKLGSRGRTPYYMRLYHKFDEAWYGEGRVFGMKGFGFVGFARKVPATVPCDGRNWFTAEMQWTGYGPSAKAGTYKGLILLGHLYSYSTALDQVRPTMGDDIRINANPGGNPYRFSVYTPPLTFLHLGEWVCFEVGILPNTPGKSDGEACFWINGRLESRVTRLRYYDLAGAFKLYATINQYRTQTDNTTAEAVVRYLDNLVIARRYIGPIAFTPARLKEFVNRGIVVHVDDPATVAAMRRARAAGNR